MSIRTGRERNRRINKAPLYQLQTSSGRTSNDVEAFCIQYLESIGFTVYKNGWPDLLIQRGKDVRAVELKPSPLSDFSTRQLRVAQVLQSMDIPVFLACPDNIHHLIA